MRITSLGYNSANQKVQNYKNNQQNPAFKGSIKLTSKNLDLVLKTADDLELFIKTKVQGTVEFTVKAIGDKFVSIVKYDSGINPSFDNQAERLVSKLNLNSAEKNTGILFEFNEGKKLN